MPKCLNNNIYLGIVLFIAILFLVLPLITYAAESRGPEVKIINSSNLAVEKSFNAFSESFDGGGSIAVCDLNGDGYDEIIIGAGPGGGPQVRIFNSLGNAIFTPGFFVYSQSFKGGINVACGDLDGDGSAEIITAPKSGGGPHIRIFNQYGQPVFTPGFFAYYQGFKGGLNLAVGDIDGAGLPEIIVAPASSMDPELKIFNRFGTQLNFDIYPFHPEFTGGVSIATANVDGGPEVELIVAVQNQDSAWVKVIKPGINKPPLGEFMAFPAEFKGGINVAGGDVDHDGYDEVIVSANSGGGPHVRTFEAYGEELRLGFFAYENDFKGGVNISSGDVNRDGFDEVITFPTKKVDDGRVKRILVDLSEQRLYAFGDGLLLKTFLVSTGLPGMDTQTGDFSISQKTYSKLYSGPGYYLPNTLWNMRFDGSRLLHGAYWHNNFGHRMSHGCVNISYPDAEWLYNITDIGTPVTVQQ